MINPPPRILFVEDDPEQSELWVRRLRSDGYDVTQASNGPDAISAVVEPAARSIDVVLMDIGLGAEMGGIEAAASLRVVRPKLPIIFMSAHEDGTTLEAAKAAHPTGYLIKPFEYRNLLAAIEKGTTRTMPELSNDHDLLVRLDVKLDLVSIQLNEARSLVAAKADREMIEPRLVKLENGLTAVQRNQSMMLGGLIILQIAIPLLLRMLPGR